MPNSSDSCARVCEILLLFELLRRQRPDLNFERVASLLSLVGKPDGPLPPVRNSRAARIIREGLVFEQRSRTGIVRGKIRDPLDLVVAGLEEAPRALPSETVATRQREVGIAQSAKDIFSQLTSAPPVDQAIRVGAPPLSFTKRLRGLIKPLKTLAANDRIQNLACGIALPFAFKALATGNPLLAGAGAMTLLGCGIEFGVDDPSFMGPSTLDVLPDLLERGLPGR